MLLGLIVSLDKFSLLAANCKELFRSLFQIHVILKPFFRRALEGNLSTAFGISPRVGLLLSLLDFLVKYI